MRARAEMLQALARLLLASLLWMGLAAYGPQDGDGRSGLFWQGSAFAAFCVLELIWAVLALGPAGLRRGIAMAGDAGGVSYALYLIGPAGALLAMAYAVLALDYGARYGRGYLVGAAGAGAGGFATVLTQSNDWAAYPLVAAGVAVSVMVIPWMVLRLLGRMAPAAPVSGRPASVRDALAPSVGGLSRLSELLAGADLHAAHKDLAVGISAAAHAVRQALEGAPASGGVAAADPRLAPADFDLHALVNGIRRLLEPQVREAEGELTAHIAPQTPFLLRGPVVALREVLIHAVDQGLRSLRFGRVDLIICPVGIGGASVSLRFEVVTDPALPTHDEAGGGVTADDGTETPSADAGNAAYRACAELVHSLGGRIGWRTRTDGGAVLWFELELAPQPARGDAQRAGPSVHGARVLLLTGDGLASELEGYLKGWGAVPVREDSAFRVFSRLLEGRRDPGSLPIVLVEAERLDMPAQKFASALRADRSLASVKAVLLDPAGAAAGERELLDAGFSAVLGSPVDKRELFNALHAARLEDCSGEKVVCLVDRYKERVVTEPLRVLVADDNRISRTVIRSILERSGLAVDAVSDGEQALDALASSEARYDLVILDLDMPGIGGLEVARTYRFMDTDTATPVVVITSSPTPEAQQACAGAGVELVLTKPVEPRLLLQTVFRLGAAKRPQPRLVTLRPRGGPEPKLDETTLNSLVRLGSGAGFLKELVQGFVQDGGRSVRRIEQAVRQRDHRSFQDAVQALKGTAGDIGAVLLVSLCIQAESITPFQMGSTPARSLCERLATAFESTCVALTEFAEKQRDAVT